MISLQRIRDAFGNLLDEAHSGSESEDPGEWQIMDGALKELSRLREEVKRKDALLSDILGKQHVLRYALRFIRQWRSDPAFNPDDEILRAENAIQEWHRQIVAALSPKSTGHAYGLPVEVLVDARQDIVHKNVDGPSRPGKSAKSTEGDG